MLLEGQMTSRVEFIGIYRRCLAKMRGSVFNLASVRDEKSRSVNSFLKHFFYFSFVQFEKTADHLFEAAYCGQTDAIDGVREKIILGMQARIFKN